MRTAKSANAIRSVTALALGCALASCGPQSQDGQTGTQDSGATTGPAATASESGAASGIAMPATPPPAAFAQCLSCHALQPGRNGIGPSLAGVAGRKAASVPGFAYSPALTAAGLTWDRPTLDRWLTAPMQAVPGTRMIYAGMSDPARRKEVIDYLETLK